MKATELGEDQALQMEAALVSALWSAIDNLRETQQRMLVLKQWHDRVNKGIRIDAVVAYQRFEKEYAEQRDVLDQRIHDAMRALGQHYEKVDGGHDDV